MRSKIRSLLIFLMAFSLLVGFVQAYSVDTLSPSTISISLKQGETQTESIHYVIGNIGNDTSVPINIGDLPEFISSSKISIPLIGDAVDGTFVLTFSPTTLDSIGPHSGTIWVGNPATPISINVELSKNNDGECRLIELPHTTTFRIKQGDTGNSGIISVKASTECPPLQMYVSESEQMTKPMFLNGQQGEVGPGEIFSFSLGLDAENVETGSYPNTYTVSGSEGNNVYNLQIPLSTLVTFGTSPIGNSTFGNLPECTVPSEMALNQSYSATCISTDPNIKIRIPYNEFFIGKSVSESEGRMVYTFEPRQYGTTDFIIQFIYKDVPIGDAFSKQIKVSPSGFGGGGIDLDFRFYPELHNSKGPVTVRVIDNNTGNVLNDAHVYLEGLEIFNNTLSLQKDKDYEIRASNIGYMDIVKTININPKYLNVSINNVYELGEQLNLSVPQEGYQIYFDNGLINLPYTLTVEGLHEIKVTAPGFTTTSKNISITKVVYATYKTPLDQLKVGKDVLVEVDRESSLKVIYIDSEGITAEISPKVLDLDSITFEPKKEGTYTVYADEKSVATFVLEEGKLWTSWWMYTIYILLIIIFFWVVIRFKNSSNESKSNFVMEG